MTWRISWRVENICKHLGINYHSPYLEKTNFKKDAIHLGELYYQLKQVVAQIIEIADKHGAEDLAKQLWKDISLLEIVDHDLIKIADIFKNRKDKD